MSLQVWLPLNGDLRNKGVANIDVTNNGATVTSNGKIGKCYNFSGNNYLKTEYNFYNNKYSVSAWIYTTSSTITQTILCNRTSVGYGFSIFLIGGKIRIDPGGSTDARQWVTSYTFPINTWFHLVVTYDGSKSSYYINGILQESRAIPINPGYWANYTSIGASQANNSNFGNYLYGNLNDVRIYNHCLSAVEVKEISRGLIVHYPLNSNIQGSTCYDCSGNGYNGTITGTLTTSTDSGRYGNSLVFSGNQRIETDSLPSETKTISLWIKTSSISDKIAFVDKNSTFACGFYSNNLIVYCNTTAVGSSGVYVKLGDKYIINKWNHIVIIKTADKTFTTYINNQIAEKNSNTQYWFHTLNNLTFGCRYYSGYQYYFDGQLSDFRAYATQLSEADILDLYQTSSKIDNTGKLHTYSIVEDSTKSSPSITRQGLTIMNNSTSGFIEDPTLSNLSITKTGQLKATEIIEN